MRSRPSNYETTQYFHRSHTNLPSIQFNSSSSSWLLFFSFFFFGLRYFFSLSLFIKKISLFLFFYLSRWFSSLLPLSEKVLGFPFFWFSWPNMYICRDLLFLAFLLLSYNNGVYNTSKEWERFWWDWQIMNTLEAILYSNPSTCLTWRRVQPFLDSSFHLFMFPEMPHLIINREGVLFSISYPFCDITTCKEQFLEAERAK